MFNNIITQTVVSMSVQQQVQKGSEIMIDENTYLFILAMVSIFEVALLLTLLSSMDHSDRD